MSFSSLPKIQANVHQGRLSQSTPTKQAPNTAVMTTLV